MSTCVSGASSSGASPALAHDVFIRAPGAADIESWMNMRIALWPEQAVDIHREQIARLMQADDRHCCLVAANSSGALRGFIEVSVRSAADGCTTGPVAYVDGIFVVPSARRAGLAQRLFNMAEEWAAGHGLLEMAADVAIDNPVAQQLHQASGFDEISRRVAYRKEVRFTHQSSLPRASAVSAAAKASLQSERTLDARSTPQAQADLDYTELLSARGRSGARLGALFYIVHGLLGVFTVLCLAMSSIYSNDIWRGGILPILGGVLVLYFVFVVLWLNSRRRR